MYEAKLGSPREAAHIEFLDEVPWAETTVQFLWGIEVARTRDQKRKMLREGHYSDVVMTWHGRYTTDFFWMNEEAWSVARQALKVDT